MIAAIRAHLAKAGEVAALRDIVVEQTAEIAALRDTLRAAQTPTPVDWSKLALYVSEADGWCDSDDPHMTAHNDQALASWREAQALYGVDVDDPAQLRTVVAGLIAAGSSSQAFACSSARTHAGAVLLSDHITAFLANAVMTLLQFRPKEVAPDGR